MQRKANTREKKEETMYIFHLSRKKDDAGGRLHANQSGCWLLVVVVEVMLLV